MTHHRLEPVEIEILGNVFLNEGFIQNLPMSRQGLQQLKNGNLSIGSLELI